MKEELEELSSELATMVDAHLGLTNELKEKKDEFVALFEEFCEIDEISAQEVFDDYQGVHEYLDDL